MWSRRTLGPGSVPAAVSVPSSGLWGSHLDERGQPFADLADVEARLNARPGRYRDATIQTFQSAVPASRLTVAGPEGRVPMKLITRYGGVAVFEVDEAA